MKHSANLMIFFILLVLFINTLCSPVKSNKLKETPKNEKKTNLKNVRFMQNNTLTVGDKSSSSNNTVAASPSSSTNNAHDHIQTNQTSHKESNGVGADGADSDANRPDLPEEMPHELEEELELLKQHEGVVNGDHPMDNSPDGTNNVDQLISNDPILGSAKVNNDNNETYKEEFSPLDFF